MGKKHYDEASVIRSLSRITDVKINTAQKTIEVKKNTQQVGNGSWGKIDYLTKVHGYHQMFVSQFGGKVVNLSDVADKINELETIIEKSKKSKKLDMAGMVKTIMRKNKPFNKK